MSQHLSRADAPRPRSQHSPAVLGLALLPFVDIDIELPDDLDIPDVQEIIRSGFDWLLNQFASGVLDAIESVLLVGYEQFLFYPNPATVPVLDDIWWLSVGVFGAIAGLSFLYMLLQAQFFPGKDKADLQYFLERVAKYFVIVFLSREVIAFFVSFTHLLASVYYQSGIDLEVGVTIAAALLDNFGTETSLLFMLLTGLVLLFAAVAFIVILLMRMLIVYVTFALLPMLMGFKLVEVGPWGLVDDMGEKFIKASAKMMVFGILVAALLWASTLAFDYSDYQSGDDSLSTLGSTDSVTVSNSSPVLIKDFMLFVTPLLMINFIGFKIIMGIV